MAATYCEITLREMDHLLAPKKFTRSTAPGGQYIYQLKLPYKGLWMIIYSSIFQGRQRARGSGQDSIKVCVFDKLTNRGYIKSKRVHRVHNWRDNLLNRCREVWVEGCNRAKREKRGRR